jgi:hypothetical protein
MKRNAALARAIDARAPSLKERIDFFITVLRIDEMNEALYLSIIRNTKDVTPDLQDFDE